MTTPPLPPGFELEQPLGQFGAGNIDLTNRPRVRNSDGSISTVRSMSANFDGREVLLPTVSDDGRIMSDDEAIDQYMRTGRNLGSFSTVEEANAYADRLHREQEQMYGGGDTPPLPPGFEMMPEGDSYGGVEPLEIEIVGGNPQRPVEQPAYRATDDMSGMERFRAGLGKSMVDTAQGLAQLTVDQFSRPANIAQAAVDRFAPGGALAEGVRRTNELWLRPQQYMQNLAAERRAADADLLDTASGSAGKIVGDIGTLLVPGNAASRASTLAGRIGGNALVGAGAGAIQPVVSEQERNKNALVGGALGAAGGAVGEGLAALAGRARAAVDPVRSRLIELAGQNGIPLHISQVSESLPLKTLASAAKYLPFSGAGKAAGRQQEAFNRAVGRTFGADAGKLTDEVMTAARQRLSDAYEGIYGRTTDIPINPQAVRELVAVETAASKRLIQPQIEVLRNQMDLILDEAASTGSLTGKKYQALRTQIMKAEGEDALGGAVKEMRKTLDSIAERAASPEDAVTLRKLRGEWANLRTVENLLKQVAGARGDITPASVWGGIRNGSTKEMRELAKLGQVVLKDPIPDSGTASRNVAYGLLGGGGLTGGLAALPGVAGLLGTGAIAGRALNSNMLARLAAQPGVATNALARTSPLASLAAVPLVVGEPEGLPDGNVGKPRLQKRR